MKFNVDEIKLNASCVDVIGSYLQLRRMGANYICKCPFHNEKSGSFTVSPTKNIYTCFGCGKTGDAIQFLVDYKKISFQDACEILSNRLNIPAQDQHKEKPKSYYRPPQGNITALSDNLVEWFRGRKISQKTLIELNVGEGVEYIPQVKQKRNCIHFNYFRNGELINTKFRDGQKNFKMVAGAELIMYNLDAIRNATEIIIVEGEIDALSLHEAGFKNVISVPNGAAVTKSAGANLIYLDNSIDYLPENAKYILALDNDTPGNTLRDELARRLGFENCYKVTFRDCKDANECLLKYGASVIAECIADKKEFPLVGIYKASNIEAEIDDYYVNGLPPGYAIQLNEFDDHLKFHLGYLTTVTGIPGDGKSEFLDFVCTKLNILHGWKFGMYSPENHPMQLHFSKYAEKLIGKPWDGPNRINPVELKQAKRHFEKNFFFINPEDDFSLANILTSVKQLIRKYGVTAFIIDAWNKLEHQYTGNESKYISEQLDKITMFCQRNGVHCFLVAHPTKAQKNPDGTFEVPNLYSISGSANFFNKTANGICVYRDRTQAFTTKIYIQKVKFKHWGHTGNVVIAWDSQTGRYYKGHPDKTNWLKGLEVQAEIQHDGDGGVTHDEQQLQHNTDFLQQGKAIAISSNDIEDYPF